MSIAGRRRVIDLINQHKDNGKWKAGTPQEAKDAEKDIYEYVKEQIRGKKNRKKEKDDGK
jgi:hypothetical protein